MLRLLLGASFLLPSRSRLRRGSSRSKGFVIKEIQTDGATSMCGSAARVRPVLHGRGYRDMWAPVAAALVHDHTACADLRGMGLSCIGRRLREEAQAVDIARVLDHLKIEKADLVTHDIGNMVGYAFAAQYPTRVTRWVVMDAPLPGIGRGMKFLRSRCCALQFPRPDMERAGAGAAHLSRSLLDELSATRRRSTRRRASIMQALSAPSRDAHASIIRGVQPGCDRQQALVGKAS